MRRKLGLRNLKRGTVETTQGNFMQQLLHSIASFLLQIFRYENTEISIGTQ